MAVISVVYRLASEISPIRSCVQRRTAKLKSIQATWMAFKTNDPLEVVEHSFTSTGGQSRELETFTFGWPSRRSFAVSLQLPKSSPSRSTWGTGPWSWRCTRRRPSTTTSGIRWWPSATWRRPSSSWTRCTGRFDWHPRRDTPGSSCSVSSTWVRHRNNLTGMCVCEWHTDSLMALSNQLCLAGTFTGTKAL